MRSRNSLGPLSAGLRWTALFLAAGCVAVCGCAGYRLGSTLPPGIRTVYVPAFLNQSGEPQLEVETTRAVLREIQRDGTLRVAGRNQADTVLHVKLTGFRLEPLRYDANRSRRTVEYRCIIQADVTFERLRPREVMIDAHQVRGSTTFIPAGNLTSAKRRALPAAAHDLAQEIVGLVVEHW